MPGQGAQPLQVKFHRFEFPAVWCFWNVWVTLLFGCSGENLPVLETVPFLRSHKSPRELRKVMIRTASLLIASAAVVNAAQPMVRFLFH